MRVDQEGFCSVGDLGAPHGPVMTEDARLAALARYDVLDTPREESFDRITRLAGKIFQAPMVMVSLLDAHRQWFKSSAGLAFQESSRGPAFCNATIRQAHPLIVHDAREHPEFRDSPLVLKEPFVRFYAGAPLQTPDGFVLGALCVMDRAPRAFDEGDVEILVDLAQIVVQALELRMLADTDALTGALSRRAFKEEAQRAILQARRHKHALSIVTLDLDHFKLVNDTYGHAAGDSVLARSVKACAGELRKSDAIGRLGGEEFAVLLPHTGAKAALAVAERLRTAVAKEIHQATGDTFSINASMGVASLSKGADDVCALLARADAAVYAAKANGRGCCVMAQSSETDGDLARRRVLKGGRILFNKGMSSIDCTVRSLSEDGAGLDVINAAGVPGAFDLSIEADRFMKPCRVVSMSERHVEVEFA